MIRLRFTLAEPLAGEIDWLTVWESAAPSVAVTVTQALLGNKSLAAPEFVELVTGLDQLSCKSTCAKDAWVVKDGLWQEVRLSTAAKIIKTQDGIRNIKIS